MLYAIARLIVQVILTVFFRVEVTGRENVPEGGCLVVSNHLSWIDTAFVMYALPKDRPIWTLANESTVFNTSFKRWLLPKLAVFPIRRNRGMLDETAIENVYQLLERNERVLIFPEGAYGRDGQLRPLKEGNGYFALHSGKPLLPVLLRGTGRLRPFKKVTVVIGKPFIPDPPRMLGIKQRVAAVLTGVNEAFSRLSQRPSVRRLRGWRKWMPQRRPVVSGDGDVERDQPGPEHHGTEQQQPSVTDRPDAVTAVLPEGGPEDSGESAVAP